MTTTSSTSSSTSITTALGVGSGIDIGALVTSLVDASFANKKQALSDKDTKLTAQISDVAQLQNGITSFSAALGSLVKGGTLVTQPTSSNSAVLNASALSGAKLGGLSASVQVTQLAGAQAATTTALGLAKTDTIGTGTLHLTFGTATVDSGGAMTAFDDGGNDPIDITIDDSHKTLAGIAAAINAKNAGVTATIVSDSDGARLTLKGSTGASQAFTLTSTTGEDDIPGLSALEIGVGATGTSVGTAAKDAIVVLDGVTLHRASNTINNLIDGVKLQLVGTSTTPVTLGSSRPTSAITQAAADFVETYNAFFATVKAATDPVSGSLRQDSAASSLQRGLQALTLTQLTTSSDAGAPLTLAAIGIGTNRDGTLSLDTVKLAKALEEHPDEVEAIFANGTHATGDGLMGAMSTLATRAISTVYGLGASTTSYTAAKSDVGADLDQEALDETDMKTRLTNQFSAMDAKVAAYKQTQAFLQQQVDAWNSNN